MYISYIYIAANHNIYTVMHWMHGPSHPEAGPLAGNIGWPLYSVSLLTRWSREMLS